MLEKHGSEAKALNGNFASRIVNLNTNFNKTLSLPEVIFFYLILKQRFKVPL